MQKTYALFDFDGTLRKGDSIVSLCLYAYQKKLCPLSSLLKGMLCGAGYGLRLTTAEKAKQAALQWLKGRKEEEIGAFALAFCQSVLIPQLYPEGLAALNREKARGASIILLTASPSFYLAPLKTLLGVEAIIGTRMNLDDQGRYTGEICGDNCCGLQKPLRLAEYLAAQGDRLDYATSAAYGDSYGDLPMLELCKTKIGVNSKPRLTRALQKLDGAEIRRWQSAAPKGKR